MSSDCPYLELALARNLIAALVTPAFVVDADGTMTFFNEAAGNLIGRRFEQSGRLSREQWNAIGPVDERGAPTSSERLPLTVALRDGRPAFGSFRIKTDDGPVLEVEASAVPLCSPDGFCGALVTFVAVTVAARTGVQQSTPRPAVDAALEPMPAAGGAVLGLAPAAIAAPADGVENGGR